MKTDPLCHSESKVSSCHVFCSFLFLSARRLLVSKSVFKYFSLVHMYFDYFLFTVPSFLVREERSLEGTPTIDVVFDDGFEDTLILDTMYFAGEDRIEGEEICDYFGHLASDLTACVAVTGCVGAEDLDITIMGERGGLFQMCGQTGAVKRIEPSLVIS